MHLLGISADTKRPRHGKSVPETVRRASTTGRASRRFPLKSNSFCSPENEWTLQQTFFWEDKVSLATKIFNYSLVFHFQNACHGISRARWKLMQTIWLQRKYCLQSCSNCAWHIQNTFKTALNLTFFSFLFLFPFGNNRPRAQTASSTLGWQL